MPSSPGNLIDHFLGPESVTSEGGKAGVTATVILVDPDSGSLGDPLPWNMVRFKL